MARTVDPVRHEERRHAILDAVERLLSVRGIDALTIADVLAEAQVSKGALYHYYTDKDELLTALIARRLDAWNDAVIAATCEAPEPARRLLTLVRTLTAAKSDDLPLLLATLPALHAEGGALMHARLRAAGRERFVPLLTQVITEGTRAGVFTSPSPSSSAAVVMSLLQEMADAVARGMSTIRDGQLTTEELLTDVRAYASAIPAVLEAPLTAEDILPPGTLDIWVEAAQKLPADPAKETP